MSKRLRKGDTNASDAVGGVLRRNNIYIAACAPGAAEKLSPETRSRMMSGIRSRNTQPELLVRRFLHSSGFRFRLFRKDLPGRPDIVLPRWKVIVFVNGCFWHAHQGCALFRIPKTRTKFWTDKLSRNSLRDKAATQKLLAMAWRVAVVWDCALRDDAPGTLQSLTKFIRSGDEFADFSANPLATSARHESRRRS